MTGVIKQSANTAQFILCGSPTEQFLEYIVMEKQQNFDRNQLVLQCFNLILNIGKLSDDEALLTEAERMLKTLRQNYSHPSTD